MADDQEHENRGFEVVDRRRTAAEESAPSEASSVPDPDDELDLEDDSENFADMSGFGGMPKLGVPDILRMSLNMLNEKAWIHMGLIPDPLTGQLDRDLTQARLAIDALADLAKHLEPHSEGAEKREIQVMVSNLRINYVQQSRQ